MSANLNPEIAPHISVEYVNKGTKFATWRANIVTEFSDHYGDGDTPYDAMRYAMEAWRKWLSERQKT